MPPATYELSPDQKGPKRINATTSAIKKPFSEPEIQVQAEAVGDSSALSRQQQGVTARAACTSGFLCPQTTLVQAGQATCNTAGPRWQAPSCKCYDTPSTPALSNAAVPLDVDSSTGKWVVRGQAHLQAFKGKVG